MSGYEKSPMHSEYYLQAQNITKEEYDQLVAWLKKTYNIIERGEPGVFSGFERYHSPETKSAWIEPAEDASFGLMVEDPELIGEISDDEDEDIYEQLTEASDEDFIAALAAKFPNPTFKFSVYEDLDRMCITHYFIHGNEREVTHSHVEHDTPWRSIKWDSEKSKQFDSKLRLGFEPGRPYLYKKDPIKGFETEYALTIQNISKEDADKLAEGLRDKHLLESRSWNEVFSSYQYDPDQCVAFFDSSLYGGKWNYECALMDMAEAFPSATFRATIFGAERNDIKQLYCHGDWEEGEYDEETRASCIVDDDPSSIEWNSKHSRDWTRR